ncbi:hypothetical protein [Sphingopyxis sp. P1IMeth2]|uniref:hypothetical protein n=1 Tax=Sphingopyxis sp. P1IMeth2 TaxID=1892848 RepID=UPI001644846C|nr:hypothetical protein [Sphingopyxis sp. P1IMeth2]
MKERIPIGPISPLGQHLIDEMTKRSFSKETQRNYFRGVGRFATWHGHSPHAASAEDIWQLQIEKQRAGVSARGNSSSTPSTASTSRAISSKMVRNYLLVLIIAEV